MEIDLSGKTAWVTGGNIGIGRGISLALARCGVDVALTYLTHRDEAEQTVTEIQALGRRALALPLDATDSAQVNAVASQAAQAFGGHIDILINNAGHMIKRVLLVEMSDEHWHRVMDVNASSAFYCARAVIPYMNTGWGRIVNMSSVAAYNAGGPGAGAYAASKAAVLTLTRAMAKEFAPRGITVNALAPGLIVETPFHDTFTTPEQKSATIKQIPLARPGVPADVAGAVVYLVSDLASFITGEVIVISGGQIFA